jgi:hypothetical protein
LICQTWTTRVISYDRRIVSAATATAPHSFLLGPKVRENVWLTQEILYVRVSMYGFHYLCVFMRVHVWYQRTNVEEGKVNVCLNVKKQKVERESGRSTFNLASACWARVSLLTECWLLMILSSFSFAARRSFLICFSFSVSSLLWTVIAADSADTADYWTEYFIFH